MGNKRQSIRLAVVVIILTVIGIVTVHFADAYILYGDVESARESGSQLNAEKTDDLPISDEQALSAQSGEEDANKTKDESDDSLFAETLRFHIRELIAENRDGRWAVYIKNLDNQDVVLVGGGKMTSASLIKLFIAGCYFESVQEGTVEDLYRDDIQIMLDRSDNDACNRMIDLLGYDRIRHFLAENGFTDTEINRRMLEVSSEENYTSVVDCGTLLERVFNKSFVNQDASEFILDCLKRQQRTGKIPSGVPAGTATANKTGELLMVENDAAIIWAPSSTYILCVMSEDLQFSEKAVKTIIDISETVYRDITSSHITKYKYKNDVSNHYGSEQPQMEIQ